MDELVTITLNRAEAIVLFEEVTDLGDQHEITICDRAARGAFWALGAMLEKALADPFQDDYAARVDRARTWVTNQYFGSESDQEKTT